MVLEHRGTTLTKAIYIDNGAQIVECIIRSESAYLRNRTLRRLAIAHQHINTLIAFVQLGIQSDTEAHGQTLSQRSGGYVYIWQFWSGMAFQVGTRLPQCQQVFAREQSCFRPCRVEHRCSVSLGKHEDVIRPIVRLLGVVAHDREEQDGNNLGR